LRVLLDACVPRRLGAALVGHETATAQELGWGDLDDGPLLDAMTGLFDVLLTVDRSLPKQQSLAHRSFAVLVLRARTNRLADLLPLVPAVLAALVEIGQGEVRELVAGA
jgi:hypothetical protein